MLQSSSLNPDEGMASPDSLTPAEVLVSCWKFLRRQYRVILICFFVALPLSGAYLFMAPVSYTASAMLLIDTRKGQFSPERAVVGDIPIDSQWIDTQLAMLVSESQLAAVVKDLRLYESPEFTTSFTEKARSHLARVSTIVGFNFPYPEPLGTVDAIDRAVGVLQRQVQVKRKDLSWIIEITARSTSPDIAAKVANAVADTFIRAQREGKLETTRHTSAWLRTSLQTLRDQLLAAENAVLEFRSKHNMIAVTGKSSNEQQLAELNTQLATVRAETITAQARLGRVEEVLRAQEPAAAVSESLSNPIITRLRTQYLELANREADYSARYGSNHLAVTNLRRQLRDLRASMRDELGRVAETYKSEYLIAKERQDELERRLADQRSSIQEVNQGEVELRQLESTARSYRTLHDTFLQRYSEAQQPFVGDEARVVSRASPPNSTSHLKAVLIALLMVLGGLGVGVAFAFLRELLDDVFRTVAQVPVATGTECLAVLPALKPVRAARFGFVELQTPNLVYPTLLARGLPTARGKTGLRDRLTQFTDLAQFTEAVRGVRLALALKRKTGDNVIGITSCVPGEGKSTFIAALARAVAQTGARTLLIDGDLRNPTLSQFLVPNANTGLMEVTAGKTTLQDAIWTEADTGLAFLPHIVTPAAPGGMDAFGSRQMEELFKVLRSQFDYVFVDLSPLSPAIDVRATTDLCDVYLLVIEWGRTKVELVKHTLSTAPKVWDKLLGAVLNRADVARMGQFDRKSTSYYDSEYFRAYHDFDLKPIGHLVYAGSSGQGADASAAR